MKTYELSSADVVVTSLRDVSVINLKNLFAMEDGKEPLIIEETEEEDEGPSTVTATAFWG